MVLPLCHGNRTAHTTGTLESGQSVEKIDRASIAATGLGVSDFTLMEAIFHKGPLRVNEIGEKVLLTSGSMTAAVNRLENIGLVQRIQDPSDGRCFYVHLTKPGRKVIQEAFSKHQKNLEKVAAILSVRERGELVRLLKKIGFHADQVLKDVTV